MAGASAAFSVAVVSALALGALLSLLSIAASRRARPPVGLATVAALAAGAGALIAGLGLLQQRLAVVARFSVVDGDPLARLWTLREHLVALRKPALVLLAVTTVVFVLALAVQTLTIAARERADANLGRHRGRALRTNLAFATPLFVFALGLAALCGAYFAPVPHATPPAEALRARIRTEAANQQWDAACQDLRRAVQTQGTAELERTLPGTRKLASVCIAGEMARAKQNGGACELPLDDPLTSLGGQRQALLAACSTP